MTHHDRLILPADPATSVGPPPLSAFRMGLADILEWPEADIQPHSVLTPRRWDSLTVIACVALIDECYGILVLGSHLARCRTIADLDDVVGAALAA